MTCTCVYTPLSLHRCRARVTPCTVTLWFKGALERKTGCENSHIAHSLCRISTLGLTTLAPLFLGDREPCRTVGHILSSEVHRWRRKRWCFARIHSVKTSHSRPRVACPTTMATLTTTKIGTLSLWAGTNPHAGKEKEVGTQKRPELSCHRDRWTQRRRAGRRRGLGP